MTTENKLQPHLKVYNDVPHASRPMFNFKAAVSDFWCCQWYCQQKNLKIMSSPQQIDKAKLITFTSTCVERLIMQFMPTAHTNDNNTVYQLNDRLWQWLKA